MAWESASCDTSSFSPSGGFALIAGIFTRLAALGLAITMLGAIVRVHLAAGFFLPDGMEFVLVLFSGAVALALTGPGAVPSTTWLRGGASRSDRPGSGGFAGASTLMERSYSLSRG